jgi:hypothetical protein
MVIISNLNAKSYYNIRIRHCAKIKQLSTMNNLKKNHNSSYSNSNNNNNNNNNNIKYKNTNKKK